MTLEEEVLAIEKEAAAAVASARAEAKGLLASVDRERQRIAGEFTARLERERKSADEESRTKLAGALAEIEKKKREGLKVIEESAARKTGDCVKAIMKDLVGA